MLLRVYCGLRNADCELNPSINPQSAIRNPQYTISIVLAARNEGARLPARLDNLLSLDYPAEKRQIVVVSDGSTDNTMDVLARYAKDVVAVSVPPSGKALALNAGLAHATGDIVVFADARQVFAPDALRELVAPFADPKVGGVTGELLLDAESPCRRAGRDRRAHERRLRAREQAGDRRVEERRRTLRSTIADGVGLYWKYEKAMRKMESVVDSTLGATGAIYAIRRALFRPLPADTILDDVLTPMRVVLAGYRVVFNERAKAFDRAAVDADAEARRKVRTLAGNYQILALEPRLLMPWANRVWLQYVSHKLGRLAVPYALLALFASSVVLAATSAFSFVALGGQVLLYLLAGCGALIEMNARRKDEAFARIPNTEPRIPTVEAA
ncbi:MAG TPA: glycosyltransferase family 2 protein [Vicinamibacterales bacterium]|nr:glycosyltransferase family 2 protein [Vicinamibacterales bacterium]